MTDDSQNCDKDTAFFLCSQNKRFLENAKKNNASAVITADEFKNNFDLNEIKIIGVTGTNGKTTTAAAIYSLLLDLGEGAALQGTRGFYINEDKVEEKSLTTPSLFQTLYNIFRAKQQGCSYFIMEVSSHGIAQKRVESLRFALKVFTNISQDHLDYHKNMEEYIRIKSSFFSDDALKLVNKDDKQLAFNPKNCYTYALDAPASFNIAAYSLNNGISAVIKHFEQTEDFYSQLYGYFNLYNMTAAIASVKLVTDYSLREICDQVEHFGGVSGRMEVVSERPLIIVDFAHTPDGMEQVLDSLKEKEIVVVFGAGGDRDRTKRPLMGKVASRYAKKIFLTSDNPRGEKAEDIIADIYKGIVEKKNVFIEVDRKKAIQEAVKTLNQDEIILILGKGDEETQEIDGQFLPFDDREVVREIIKENFNR